MTQIDAALFLLRVVAGVTLALHGLNKIKGGLDGVGRWFASMGMRPGALHARLAAFTEVGAGVLLTIGLATPAAGAGFAGVMLVAGWVAHRRNGFFIFRPGEGWEYTLVLGVVGLALAGLGAGRWSLDHAFGVDYGSWGMAAAAVAGLGGGVVTLLACYRTPNEAKS